MGILPIAEASWEKISLILVFIILPDSTGQIYQNIFQNDKIKST